MSVLSPETLTHLEELLAKASIDWQRPHLGLTNVGEAWKTAGLAGHRDDAELACAAVNALPALLQAARDYVALADGAGRMRTDRDEWRERAERAERERDELREAAAECVDYVTAVCHCEWSDDDFGSITRANPDCEVHGGHGRIDRLREAIAAATPAALGRVGAGEGEQP